MQSNEVPDIVKFMNLDPNDGWIHWRDELPRSGDLIDVLREDFSVDTVSFDNQAGTFARWRPARATPQLTNKETP